MRITTNEQTSRQQLKQISIATLVEHYREHELPDIFYKTPPTDDERKSASSILMVSLTS